MSHKTLITACIGLALHLFVAQLGAVEVTVSDIKRESNLDVVEPSETLPPVIHAQRIHRRMPSNYRVRVPRAEDTREGELPLWLRFNRRSALEVDLNSKIHLETRTERGSTAEVVDGKILQPLPSGRFRRSLSKDTIRETRVNERFSVSE